MILVTLLVGLSAGVLVGLLGIGGGVVLIPAMVHLLHMDQHLAQGTSLLILLPPVGLGALREYWKIKQVDLRAGILCALGMLLGGYLGSLIALPMSSRDLGALFGCFLVLAAFLLWSKSRHESEASQSVDPPPRTVGWRRSLAIFAAALVCGVASGLFGIGGGVLLIPMLALLFAFSQHRAQGTSLVALIPPTGLLAFLAYNRAGDVSWKTGLLLIPGVFFGGICSSALAKRVRPRTMRMIFAGAMLALGLWEALTGWFG